MSAQFTAYTSHCVWKRLCEAQNKYIHDCIRIVFEEIVQCFKAREHI